MSAATQLGPNYKNILELQIFWKKQKELNWTIRESMEP